MKAIVLYTIFWPVIAVCKVAEFVVWDFLSSENWKAHPQGNLARYWQNHALAAQRQLRDMELESKLQQVEFENKFRKELKHRGQK